MASFFAFFGYGQNFNDVRWSDLAKFRDLYIFWYFVFVFRDKKML